MEELVAAIEPIYAQDASLLRWVALRGALHGLSDAGAGTTTLPIGEAVGFHWDESSNGWSALDAGLSPQQTEAALGLLSSIMSKVVDYHEISELSIEDVNEDQRWRLASFNRAMALDYIAWSAVVLCRLEASGHLPPVPSVVPQPSRLETAGWYVDPLFGKAGRYWNGADWTDRVRLSPDHPNFKQYGESVAPL
jgi:hypothetical protein